MKPHRLAAACVFALLVAPTAHGDGALRWSTTKVELLSGGGFELGSDRRHTLTLEHASGWRYGDNFVFLDTTRRDDVGVEAYGEWWTRLSLGRTTGAALAAGPLRDVLLVGGITAGSEPEGDAFKAFGLGVGFDLDIPHARFLTLNVVAFKNEDVDSTGVQVTPAWAVPFTIGTLHFEFRGFLDWVSRGGSGRRAYVHTQPQLLLDLGRLLGRPAALHAGIEYWYWHHKFGIAGVEEHAAQAIVSYAF
ncbi:MAG: DUF5020 domain-containing protein [Gammaproteobacteria bacterium]